MRVVVLSDIHGNLEALNSVADALPTCDDVIVAGDHCLDGPQPAEVWDRLRELSWRLLMGNTDRDIISPPSGLKRKKAEALEWTRKQLGVRRRKELSRLPFSLRAGPGEVMLVVHANPRNMDEHLPPTMTDVELRPYLEGVDAEIVAFGHLHTPYIRPVGKQLLVDVSSVGHPKDNDLRSVCTLFEWNGDVRTITQTRIPYDVERAVRAFETCGMPSADKEIASLLKASY